MRKLITVGEHQVQEATRMHSLQVVFEVHTFCAFAAKQKQTDKKMPRKIFALNRIVLYGMFKTESISRTAEHLFTLPVFINQIKTEITTDIFHLEKPQQRQTTNGRKRDTSS